MTELTYMPQQVFMVLVVLNAVMIYYGFTSEDDSYYTDIISVFGGFILSAILAYNSIIGIGIYMGSDDYFVSKSLAIALGAISGLMLLFTVVKILELGKNEADKL